jgi:uncharacterized membrane protein YheB (UPF0754 family)
MAANLILKIIAGGFTGYITNTYAINMLFKTYTPLNLGGVIIKTKDEFINDVSSLVEKRLIKDQSIGSKVNLNELNDKLTMAQREFWEKYLPNECRVKLEAIDGCSAFLESIKDDIKESKIDLFFEELKNSLGDRELRDILNVEPIERISKDIAKGFEIEIQNLNDENFEFLTLELEPLFQNAHARYLSAKDNSRLNMQSALDGKNSIAQNMILKEQFYSEISERSISAILPAIDQKKFKYELKILLKAYILENIKSDQKSIWAKKFYDRIQNLDYPIIHFLREPQKEILKNWLVQNLPQLTTNLLSWIVQKKDQIEDLLQSSIDEVVESTKGQRSPMIQSILENKTKSIVQDKKLIELLTNALENAENTFLLGEYLADNIIEKLEHKNVSDIVKYLNENFGFNTGILEKIIDIILAEIIDGIDLISIDFLLDKKLRELGVIGEKLKILVERELVNKIEGNIGSKLELMQDGKELEHDLKKWISLLSKTDILSTWVENMIDHAVSWNFGSIINLFLIKAGDSIFEKIDSKFEKYEKFDLAEILEKVRNIGTNRSEDIDILEAMYNHLDGKIEGIIKNQLEGLEEQELLELVHDFMGRELKPISYFGAGLGAVAGLALSRVDSSIYVNAATFGAVGYLTNVIALQMLFRPYKQNKLLSRIPLLNKLDQGYIVKNKAAFGKNLGEAVANHLLHQSSIENYITENRIQFETSVEVYMRDKIQDDTFNSFIKENTCFRVKAWTDEYWSDIVLSAFSFLKDRDNFSKLKISEELSKTLEYGVEKYLKGLEKEQLRVILEKIMDDEIDLESIWDLRKIMESYEGKTLTSIIGNNSYEGLKTQIALKARVEFCSEKCISKFLNNLNERILNVDESKSIEKLFDGKLKNLVDTKQDRLFDFLKKQILSWLVSQKKTLSEKIDDNIKSSLGFFEKIGYMSADGPHLVEDITEHLIETKFPEFIELEISSIRNLSFEIVDKAIWKSKVSKIHDVFEQKVVFEKLSTIITDRKVLVELGDELEKIVIWTMDEFKTKSLFDILNLLGIESELFKNRIIDKFDFSRGVDDIEISSQLIELLISEIKAIAVEGILVWLEPEWINDEFKSLYNGIHFKNMSTKFIENSLFNTINKESFADNIVEMFGDINDKSKLNEELKRIADLATVNLINDLFDKKVPDEVIKDLSRRCSSAILESGRDNLEEILQIIDLKKLIEMEVDEMSAVEIHELFKGFAGRYFRKLEAYGGIGAVFGLLPF